METQVFIDAKVVNAFFTGDEATRTALSKIYPELDFGKQNQAIKLEVDSQVANIIAKLRTYFQTDDLRTKQLIEEENKGIDFQEISNEVLLSVIKRSLDTEFNIQGKTFRFFDMQRFRQDNPHIAI